MHQSIIFFNVKAKIQKEQELGHLDGIYFGIGQLTLAGQEMSSIPGGWTGGKRKDDRHILITKSHSHEMHRLLEKVS